MADLEQLMSETVAFRNARGWERGHTPENVAKSIIIEAAELLELFQWHPLLADDIRRNPEVQTRIAEELADIVIYSLSLADTVGINMSDAIRDKLKKNAIKYPT